MQSIPKLSTSTLVTSAALITFAMLGSSKRLIEHFPGTTQRGLLLSATLGIVAKIVSEKIPLTKHSNIKKYLTPARVALCMTLALPLGVSLRASLFLFALSEACAQRITTFLRNKKCAPIIQAIQTLLPQINDFADQQKWVLWFVKTQARDSSIETARATALLIQDPETQNQALFEIVKVAIDKRVIGKAKEIAASMHNTRTSSSGFLGQWRDRAYIEIVIFEAGQNIQTAQDTLAAVKKDGLSEADFIELAIAKCQALDANSLFIQIQKVFHTDDDYGVYHLPLFIERIKTAAQKELNATKTFVSSMKNNYLQCIAWIEINKIDQNTPIENAESVAKAVTDNPCTSPEYRTPILLAYVKAVACHDLNQAKQFARFVKEDSELRHRQEPCHALVSKALFEIVKIEMRNNLPEALTTARNIPTPLYRDLALVAIAKQLTKQPHQDFSFQDVRQEIGDPGQPYATIEYIKVLAKSGDIAQAQQRAFAISELPLQLRALISILKVSNRG